MTALNGSKQEQPQVWVIFLGLIMEVEEMEIGSLQDYSPFTRRHFKLAWRGEEGYVGSQLFSWTVGAAQVLLGVKGACRDYQYMADSFIPQILNS